MSDLVERLRHADVHSQQRVLGSRIFGEAADRIAELEKERDAAIRARDDHMRNAQRLAARCVKLEDDLRTPRARELKDLLDRANERVARMTPEERQAMKRAQRDSFIRAMTTPCEHGVLDFEQCGECRGGV